MPKYGDVVFIIFVDEIGVELVIKESEKDITLLSNDGSIIRMLKRDLVHWIKEDRVHIV